jgi:cytochrome b6-f complex iron-sulfur subunit
MAQIANENQRGSFSRRRLLRWALLGTMGAIFAQAGIGFLNFLHAQQTGPFGGVITVGNLNDFAPNSVTKNINGKFYLSNVAGSGLVALFWRCRHLGCTVPWNEDEVFKLGSGETVTGVFHCPCHGSVYTRDGQIQAGPAPGPLDLMEMTIGADGTVTVDTGAIRRRDRVRPDDFLPAQPGVSGPLGPDLTPHGTEI